jgi:hypothetical protein
MMVIVIEGRVMSNCLWRLGCMAVIGFATGCGSKPPESSLQVSGRVTLDGNPLQGAIVTFNPIGQTQGTGASATTDAAGNYKLQPRRRGETVVEGKYRITIARFQPHDDPSGSSPKHKNKVEGTVMELPGFDGPSRVIADVSMANNKFNFDVGADRLKPGAQ